MQEVAKRARETGPIVTAPKKKPEVKRNETPTVYEGNYRKASPKDVNLPIEGASPEVRERARKMKLGTK